MNKKFGIFITTLFLSWSLPIYANEVVKTRFGKVSIVEINSEPTILINGSKLSHQPEHSYIFITKKLSIGDKDVILLQGVDGTACPAQYYFLAIGKNFSRITNSFGTCSDLIKVNKSKNQKKIILTMPGFRGPFESNAERNKAAKQRYTYEYDINYLKENGKIIN